MTALAYRVYILFTLGFIAQLHPPPPDWTRAEAASLRALVKGPRCWARPNDLHQLHTWYGLPWEFDKLEDIAAASQLRALAHAGPGGLPLGIGKRYRRLCQARRTTNRWEEEIFWDHWLSHNASASLWSNQQEFAAQGITMKGLEQDLKKGMPLPLT